MALVVPQIKTKDFSRIMNNVIDYSIGFLDGTQKGKSQFLKQLGMSTIEGLKRFIDVQAKMSPGALHHIYEWHKTGSPDARLYSISMSVKGDAVAFFSNFSQSRSLKEGSNVPFYNKAKIMEEGVSVVIKPRNSNVLAFTEDGQDIFTPNPVVVNNPGGDQVKGSYEKTFDSFFQNYFSQSFLRSSGIFEYLSNPKAFKSNFQQGSIGGRRVGYNTGYSWIVNATIEVE
jgi:hypothetical protein